MQSATWDHRFSNWRIFLRAVLPLQEVSRYPKTRTSHWYSAVTHSDPELLQILILILISLTTLLSATLDLQVCSPAWYTSQYFLASTTHTLFCLGYFFSFLALPLLIFPVKSFSLTQAPGSHLQDVAFFPHICRRKNGKEVISRSSEAILMFNSQRFS